VVVADSGSDKLGTSELLGISVILRERLLTVVGLLGLQGPAAAKLARAKPTRVSIDCIVKEVSVKQM
jgi:hypothetical protein